MRGRMAAKIPAPVVPWTLGTDDGMPYHSLVAFLPDPPRDGRTAHIPDTAARPGRIWTPQWFPRQLPTRSLQIGYEVGSFTRNMLVILIQEAISNCATMRDFLKDARRLLFAYPYNRSDVEYHHRNRKRKPYCLWC